ncbi:hypothetical protein Tco_0928602 [Tanacetum coccineum]
MLEKKPNKVCDTFLKAGLGYTNPERLKKVIEARPKMYDGDLIHNNKLGIHTTDSEETLEDAEESQNKMRHKMIQIDYEKLNALYETFVPHQEFSAEQTYFSISSTSHNGSTSKDVPSKSPVSTIEPKNIKEAMLDASWIESMHDELNQFKRLDVWELVECPIGGNIIAVKCIWKNKTDAEKTVHQSPRGIFICQSQYTMDLLKKHGMEKCDTISTPMTTTKLEADLQGTQVDQTKYRSMIGGLMYLTASRPNIAFATFVCARYQAHPTEKHLKEVKTIFQYLRQTINMGLLYWKDSGFELIAYSDADLAGCNDDCKSTSGGIQFLRDKLEWSPQVYFLPN